LFLILGIYTTEGEKKLKKKKIIIIIIMTTTTDDKGFRQKVTSLEQIMCGTLNERNNYMEKLKCFTE